MLRFVFLVFTFLFLLPTSISAQVVINEILANPEGPETGEFIEIYNLGLTAVNLDGYKLSDLQKSYLISGITINPNEYKTFYQSDTGIEINNSGNETISLEDNTSQVVSTHSFSNTIEGKSWSRIPNATGNFVNNTNITPNAENASPPTSTSTPTPSPTPTTRPANTSTATTTPTTKPTSVLNSPTKSVSPSVSPEVKADTDEKSDNERTKSANVNDLRSQIQGGESDEAQKDDEKNPGKPFPVVAMVFVFLGIMFVGLAGFLFWKKKKNLEGTQRHSERSEES